jgi:pimeloyl-ACP methyl ester carboxylesterase
VRQPEVARLAGLVLALLLVLPLVDAARAMVVAGAFVTEFLSDGAWQPLSRFTTPPARTPMSVPGAAVDRYTSGSRELPAVPLVLVHGLTPDGKDDARLASAATLLARAGFAVAVPTIPGLTRWRLRPDDREPVIATLATVPAPSAMVGVSVGAGVALLAAADGRVRDRVQMVVSLGGYASAVDLVRYYLTGEYVDRDGTRRRRVHDPELVRIFVDANRDLIDASARRVLEATDPGHIAQALGELSPDLARLLDTLSPVRGANAVRADVILVHGRDDIAVPYTESVALRHARGARTRLVLVGLVEHVEAARTVTLLAGVRDLVALWSVAYVLVSLA